MEREDMIARICRDFDGADLPAFLAGLPAPDLQSLLLEVYRRRAGRLSPDDVLRQYRSSRFVKPSGVPPDVLHRIDQAAYALLRPLYTPLELSPLAPLGSASALGPVDQINIVSTIRNTEVCPDLTNAMALECAVRRKELLRRDARSKECVRLCASQRLVRAQPFDDPNSFAHFGVLGLCTAGQDEGSHAFEERAIREHIDFNLALLNGFNGEGFRFERLELEIVIYDPAATGLAERIAGRYGCPCKPAEHKLSYYKTIGLHLYAVKADGERIFLTDGGFTDWTAKLLSNSKERLMISGLGTERFAHCFADAEAESPLSPV